MSQAQPIVATAPSSAPRPTSMRQLVVSGSIWTLVGFGAGQVLRLASNLVLARLLFPEAFGLVGMVGIFTQGLQMFSDIGIGPSIIQNRRGDDRVFLDTAWTVQALRGLGLWLATCLIAWPLSLIYRQPELLTLLPVGGLVALIGGFNSTSLFGASRRMAIRKLVILDLGCQVVTAGVMISWAWLHPSVWALLAGGLAGGLVRMVLSHTVLGGERDRFRIDRACLKDMVHFGRWIFFSTALTFISTQVDRLVLAALVPMSRVGVYSVALSMARIPAEVAAKLCGDVLFPALSRTVHSDRPTMKAQFERARGVILPLVMEANLGVALGAPVFFKALYDTRYADAAWIAPLMALAFWFELLHVTADRALLAIGATRSLAVSNAAKAAVTVGACLLGNHFYGLPGFVSGLCAGSIAGHLVIQISMARAGLGIVKTDLAYTAGFVALGLGAILTGRALEPYLGALPAEGAAAALVLTLVGVWAARRAVKGVWDL